MLNFTLFIFFPPAPFLLSWVILGTDFLSMSLNLILCIFFSVLGLLLRTVCNNWSHTVYSLVLSASLVYCGTKTGTIPAFEFSVSFELIQINEK